MPLKSVKAVFADLIVDPVASKSVVRCHDCEVAPRRCCEGMLCEVLGLLFQLCVVLGLRDELSEAMKSLCKADGMSYRYAAMCYKYIAKCMLTFSHVRNRGEIGLMPMLI